MLQFNLSKLDRIVIHKRIASSHITPKEISLMSSTDLANEETKQSIKIAEKEALEHSILQKAVIPRAKITHKGLQDIEDIDGGLASMRDRESERDHEQEDEERRERERMARLKAAQAHQLHQRSTSVSVPPESPIVQQGATWGAPPPLPVHAMQSSNDASSSSFGASRPLVSPLYINTTGSSDMMVSEPELNLADLINIDEDPSTSGPNVPPSPQALLSPDSRRLSEGADALAISASPVPATGISPFAANVPHPPELRHRSTSFDLNALWIGPKKDASATPVSPSSPHSPPHAPVNTEDKDVMMDSEILGQEADDQDFDMFLEEKDQETATVDTAEAQQAAFDGLPQVWSGKVDNVFLLPFTSSDTNSIRSICL